MMFIYALADGNTIRYVGKSNDPEKRFAQHLCTKSSRRVNRWIDSLRKIDRKPTLIILEEVFGDWKLAERKWITHYRSLGADLCNHTDGGDGVSGLDAESRARLSESMRIRFKDPASRAYLSTPERGRRLSAALTGKKKSPEHVAKLWQNQKGRKLSPEHREKVVAALRRAPQFIWPAGQNPLHTPEAKSKNMLVLIGNTHTLGRVMPEHEKIQRSLATIGRPKSEEHKEKIRQGAIRRWARHRENQK